MSAIENERDTFAKRFKSLRIPGETQSKFAARIGLTQPTVALYESGRRTPDIETLGRICRVCGCSADWLIGISDTKSPEMDMQGVVEYTGLWEDAINKLVAIKGKEESFLLSTLIAYFPGFRRFLHIAVKHMTEFTAIRVNQVLAGETDSFNGSYFDMYDHLAEHGTTVHLADFWASEMRNALNDIPWDMLVCMNRVFFVHYCCDGEDPEDNSINPLQRYFEKTVLEKT